jgi:hypothetical protein
LAVLKSIDDFMAESSDPRLAWVTVSRSLKLHTLEGMADAEICRQMGVSERVLNNSAARFQTMIAFDLCAGKLVSWL